MCKIGGHFWQTLGILGVQIGIDEAIGILYDDVLIVTDEYYCTHDRLHRKGCDDYV